MAENDERKRGADDVPENALRDAGSPSEGVTTLVTPADEDQAHEEAMQAGRRILEKRRTVLDALAVARRISRENAAVLRALAKS